MLITLTYLLTY